MVISMVHSRTHVQITKQNTSTKKIKKLKCEKNNNKIKNKINCNNALK